MNRHIQNPAIVRKVYSSITQPYSGTFITLCNTFKYKNLTYSQSWDTQSPFITGSRRILKTLRYKPCVTLEVQNTGILKVLEYSEPDVFKTRHIFRTLFIIVILDIYIYIYTGIFTSYSDMPYSEFWHVLDPRHIFRHIQAYSVMVVVITLTSISSI